MVKYFFYIYFDFYIACSSDNRVVKNPITGEKSFSKVRKELLYQIF